jgi:hypothetical protein
MDELAKLSDRLFEIASRRLSKDQREFLAKKWELARDFGCQNAGLKKWGSHLLKIGPALHNRLDKTFSHLVAGIELTGFKLWKEGTDDPHLEKLLQFLLDDQTALEDAAFTKKEKLAFFLNYDSQIVASYRERFEQIFADFFYEKIWQQHDPLVTSMLIGNLIGLYPLFDPPDGHKMQLLVSIQGVWNLCRYHLHSIPLGKENIKAYGLEPQDGSAPLLLFPPTPYPAARGFWEAIKSDLSPFHSVGETLFKKGESELSHWMQGKSSVQCYGVSLGGAMAYLFARKFKEQAIVHAYVPPGLSFKASELSNICGSLFYHVNDFIASLGFHPTGDHFKSYAVITEADRNFVLAHTRPAGCSPTVVLEINGLYENRRLPRRVLTWLKPIGGAVLFLVLLPLRLAGKLYRFIKNF